METTAKTQGGAIARSFRALVRGESPNFVLWTLPLLILFIFSLPFLLTRKVWTPDLAFNNTGQIGDTIGGIVGPVVALIAAFLTFFAFWVQYKSNKAQTRQFKKQDKVTKLDRFETRFYELLRFHRENVSEMEVGGHRNGRRVFLAMYEELKFIYHATKLVYGSQKELKKDFPTYTEEDLLNISFVLFLYGIGPVSRKMTDALLPQYDKDFLNECNNSLESAENKHRGTEIPRVFSHKEDLHEIYFELNLSYVPFQGHISRLGHYFRHLYQTVRYVSEQPGSVVKNKLEYINTLRAQLSSHEQLLLYYHAFTFDGKSWFGEKYFTDARFIYNIPLPLADFGVSPIEKLGSVNSKGESLFELQGA